jgi:glycosyltransferase involved in cell wall biosynthesis
MTPPLPVSVLLPALNAARHLRGAVDSVLAQTFRDFELLIIDDGSADDTRAIAEAYAARDPRVRVLSHPNKGMGRALNDAMEVARGTWVARIDADDEMLPTRLERQMAFAAAHPEVAVTATLVNYADDAGRVIGRSTSDLLTPAAVAAAVAGPEPIHVHHPAVLARRSVLLEVGGYRPQFWPADDVDLWNRVVERGHLLLVQPEHLTNYRIHGSSVCVASARGATEKLEWVRACMHARRRGEPEPAWDAFAAALAARPWPTRVNGSRRHVARTLYKRATLHFAGRDYARFLPALAGAALLEPGYVWEKVGPQLSRRRTRPAG